jgi:hypothetical protein
MYGPGPRRWHSYMILIPARNFHTPILSLPKGNLVWGTMLVSLNLRKSLKIRKLISGSVLSLNASIDAECPEKCRPKEHRDWIYC